MANADGITSTIWRWRQETATGLIVIRSRSRHSCRRAAERERV